MKKILVPVDFTPTSLEAVKFASNLALKGNGEIRLLHVVELPVMYDSTLMPALYFEKDYYAAMKQNAEKNFTKIKSKLKTDEFKITTQVEQGHFLTILKGAAKKWKAELIVIGTHGASGIREFVIGSNTEKVVREADIPVIAIKESGKLTNLKDIVFAMPLYEYTEELVQELKRFQDFLGAKLHLVHINTPINFRRDAQSLADLKAFAKRFMLKNFTTNIYNDLDEEDGLRDFAESKLAGVIAMATHGRKGLAHFMAGSLTEDVVNHVKIPIWSYRIKKTDTIVNV